jgi:hypothetical protein
MPENPTRPSSATAPTPAQDPQASRRRFMLLGLSALLAGCAEPRLVRRLPGPAWEARPAPRPPVEGPPVAAAPRPAGPSFPGVFTRGQWASGHPIPSRMNTMLPVRWITVHHDGMDPFTGDDARAAAHRLDAIRRAHVNRGWGDIGYHFAVDRAGNVWEGRPLAFQGAHVKNHNEYNIGVVALGNFDRQEPTRSQLAALHRHVRVLMSAFNIPATRLRTHQEWAPTACPGRNLQRYMVTARSTGTFG